MALAQSPSPLERAPDGVPAGVAIGLAALLTLVTVSHHPTMKPVKAAEAFPAIVALAPSDRLVHAIVIATMLGLVFGFAAYALRRGLHRSTVVGGFVAFSFGIAVTIGAALVDGFLVPDLASRFVDAAPQVMNQAAMFLQVCGLVIQIATKAGLLGMSLGILLWSADLVRDSGVLRVAGIVGVVSGILPLAFVPFGGLINPHVLVIAIGIQTLWYLTIATLLVLRRI